MNPISPRQIRFHRTLARLLACALLFAPLPGIAFEAPRPTDLPEQISVRGETVQLKDLTNPYRRGPMHEQAVREGGDLYFKNCVFCHGDLLDGRGVFGTRFSPPAANLQYMWTDPPKRENYAFWRIVKGGPGLPEQFEPWNSAMPAWENVLSTDEIWKVITYVYETIQNPQVKSPADEPSVDRGQAVYAEKCVYCHGPKGDGKTGAAALMSPRPRNLVKGQFKFRTTPFGKIPTDDDLMGMLTRGMPHTTMPSWKHLGDTDLESLVLYLKTLSSKFEKFVKKGKSHKIVQVPEPAPFTLESVERGRQEFIKNCSGCHGVNGRSDGASTKKIVDLASDALRPRNLTKSWSFRRGFSRKDLFLTLRTGLSTTAMPMFSPRVHSDEKIWDIVNYITTLSPAREPETRVEIRVQKMDGELPTDPGSPVWQESIPPGTVPKPLQEYQWKAAPAHYVPLGGQVMGGEKATFTTVDSVWVQALHNGRQLAIRLVWDDPTVDPILKTLTSFEESQPPPLPPELQGDPGEEPPQPEPQAQKIPDALELQFPTGNNFSGPLPYFLNGDAEHTVHLWKWVSFPNVVVEANGRGLGQTEIQSTTSQQVKSQVRFRKGQYQLVMIRDLATDDSANDVQFASGAQIPIAFHVWDGNESEAGTKMATSSWFRLTLE